MNTKQLASLDLRFQPFEKSIPDSDLWLPPSKDELVEDFCSALHNRHWALLTGDPGVGKTCVLRAVRRKLGSEGFQLTYCCNSTLGKRDFYRQLCTALGLAPKATAAAVFDAITHHVQEIARESTRPVFLIDEAHLLQQDVLDHLHILGNYQWDSAPLLTLVLIGLPELEDRLAARRNRSLYSRIAARFRIGTLKPEDTADYLRARLKAAGCTRELFPSDSVSLLHEATSGTLRDLDRLAGSALLHAARRSSRLVERQHVTAAIRADRPERP